MPDLSALTLVIGGDPQIDLGATGGLTLNSQVIPDVADPVAAQDAATKNYVDTTVASWTTVLTASSIVDQGPVALDTIHQIEFGAAQGSGSDPVQLSAAGAITFNQAGYYNITVGGVIGRATATASAFLIFRVLVDAVQVTLGGTTELSDNDNKRPTSVTSLSGNFSVGQVITLEMHRSSQGGSGQNDGALFAIPNTGALAWGTSPSATIKINKFNP